ncbi:MAG TPA: MinD/ParA family protein [Chondromyces sp.]|nr:MinD/ParA family protein [Chondromyces sp.]
MKDQAEALRRRLLERNRKPAKILAVVSGKGGVGKSNISINFAVGLSRLGNKVLVLDLDMGMGNIHLLFGQQVEKSIVDFVEKDSKIEELIIEGSEGVSCLFGGSGLGRLLDWKPVHFERWVSALERLQYEYDYLLFDMGAGATKESLELLIAAEEILVVTTPEPTAIMDAYSMMKYIHLKDQSKRFYLVCNRAETNHEGAESAERLAIVMKRFLDKEISILAILPEDVNVRKAVKRQIPFLVSYPNSTISRSMEAMVKKYVFHIEEAPSIRKKANFISKLRYFFYERQRLNG